MNIRTELEKAGGHRFAEPGATARDQNVSAGKKLFAEHGAFPSLEFPSLEFPYL
jgi:hypothetical protein